MKKLCLLLTMLLIGTTGVNAASKEPVKVYLFWSESCGYCEMAIESLNKLEDKYENIFELVTYDVNEGDNSELFYYLVDEFGNGGGIPYFVIGEQTVEGADVEKVIEIAKEELKNEEYVDFVANYVKENREYSPKDLEHACNIKGIEYWDAKAEKNSSSNTAIVAIMGIIIAGLVGYIIISPKSSK